MQGAARRSSLEVGVDGMTPEVCGEVGRWVLGQEGQARRLNSGLMVPVLVVSHLGARSPRTI